MDAICINQEDLQEKAAQIPLMGEIYTRAIRVLACIGPRADGSDTLTDQMGRLEVVGNAPEWDGLKEWVRSGMGMVYQFESPFFDWKAWLRDELGLEFLAEFRAVITAFSVRRYWSRLWVVQELAASNGCIDVLCP